NRGSVESANLNSSGIAGGGKIEVSALNQIKLGEINSSSTSGNGGAIALSSGDNIITNAINSSGNLSGGKITLESKAGTINTSLGEVNSSGNNGTGGELAFKANSNIITNAVNSTGKASGGEISFNSTTGKIDTSGGQINSSSTSGNGGLIAFTATDNIITNAINSSGNLSGGKITLESKAGTINTNLGEVNSSGNNGTGGSLNFAANGNIITSNIRSNSTVATGGEISLKSKKGIVESGNLDASGNSLGGNISVISPNQITTRQINSSATTGKGGNVLLDPQGNIKVDYINAQGGTQGTGGKVDITTGSFFRATDTFIDRNGVKSSISTAGGTGGGEIIIRHGGASVTPFVVVGKTANGTAGNITTGPKPENTIQPGAYFGPFSQGNIQLVTPGSDIIEPTRAVQTRTYNFTRLDRSDVKNKVSLDTTVQLRDNINQAITNGNLDIAVALIEKLRLQEYSNYLGLDLSQNVAQSGTIAETKTILKNIANQTGKTPAIIYVFSQPEQLQLILVTPEGKPILRTISEAQREVIFQFRDKLISEVTRPNKRQTTSYKASASQLYKWLITPLESELQAQKIDTLMFSMDTGLRSLPLAAMYNGQQFVVEKYTLGLVPSINLTDTRYRDISNSQILAMGASKFVEQSPLPGVPLELATITKEPWQGKSFLNETFTLANLKSQRKKEPAGIIHLATHGQFQSRRSK
ncbi:MAG: CHAT domain-containing protein, partial [Potamolinea sp.]